MEEKQHFTKETKISPSDDELEENRRKRAQKTKNRILTEVYHSDGEISLYKIYKNIQGIPQSSIYDQVIDLGKRGMVKITKRITGGGKKRDFVELTEKGKNIILADTGDLYREVALYSIKKLEMLKLDNGDNLSLSKNKSFFKLLFKMRELGLIEGLEIKTTPKWDRLLGL